MINEHFDTEFEDWKDVFPECEEIVDVNSPRVSQKEKSKRRKKSFCSVPKDMSSRSTLQQMMRKNVTSVAVRSRRLNISLHVRNVSVRTIMRVTICVMIVHTAESHVVMLEMYPKRPPKRRAAVEALRVVTGDVVDTETKEDVEEKEEEEDSDSGSDFDTDDEDDDDDDDDDDAILGMMNSTELDLNSPRGFGHRRRKKVDACCIGR